MFNFGLNFNNKDIETKSFEPFGVDEGHKKLFGEIVPGKSLVAFRKEDFGVYNSALVVSKNDKDFTLSIETLNKDDNGKIISKINHPYVSVRDLVGGPWEASEAELKEFE